MQSCELYKHVVLKILSGCQESDWQYVGLGVQKARKQGIKYTVRFGIGPYNYNSSTANTCRLL